MTSADLFLYVATTLAVIGAIVALGPPIWNVVRRWLHPIPHALIIELSERARRGEHLEREDISEVMSRMTASDYASLPPERQRDLQRILDAASRRSADDRHSARVGYSSPTIADDAITTVVATASPGVSAEPDTSVMNGPSGAAGGPAGHRGNTADTADVRVVPEGRRDILERFKQQVLDIADRCTLVR